MKAVVIGGSNGLGLAITICLIKKGYRYNSRSTWTRGRSTYGWNVRSSTY